MISGTNSPTFPMPAEIICKNWTPYAVCAIVTWAASLDELLLFFDYIYRLAGT